METNKQKAEEIAHYCSVMPPTRVTQSDVVAMTTNAAMQAMEWKDAQLKKYLIKRVESLDDDDFAAKQIIGGIYKDLFENDK